MACASLPWRRPRSRAGGLALAGTLCALSAVSVTARAADDASPAICGSGPLEILLTNDDGYQAPGIRALYEALRQAGHHVLLAGPASNASGSSTSFTWSTVSVVRDSEDPHVFGISATPATAVVLAATALYPAGHRPDLVVSGINDGENTGSLLALSGTVGAALAGTMLLDPAVPGIAVSAARLASGDPKSAVPADRLHQIARHLAQLIGSSRTWFCDRGKLARPTTVLNVNYPARPIAEVRGIAVARQGRTTDLTLEFEPTGTGLYAAKRQSRATPSDYADSDVSLLAEGYVTVTPISAQLGGREVPIDDLKRRFDSRTRR
jgi:5'-nucleotidase